MRRAYNTLIDSSNNTTQLDHIHDGKKNVLVPFRKYGYGTGDVDGVPVPAIYNNKKHLVEIVTIPLRYM
jgi:hypothetical protein